ncbi:MAG: putative cytokinetic ring protein SteA [Actinomycetota bacterium]
MIRTRPRAIGRARPTEAVARVDARTKRLVQRLRPGDVAVVDHEDLDRVSAEALVAAGASAVVNAAPSISGRYPNLGPSILAAAGIPVVDRVGPLALRKIADGDVVTIQGDRVVVDGRVVAVGRSLDADAIDVATREAGERLADRFESFARNTVEYMQRERDLLFGGAGLPTLRHPMEGRPVLVVVRGTGYREDLAALAPWIRDARPVLVGVDGGADALVEAGYRPDLIVGDMDSVSDAALRLAAAGSTRSASRRSRSPRRGRARTSRSSSPTMRAPRRSWRSVPTGTFASSSTRGAEACRARSWCASAWARS